MKKTVAFLAGVGLGWVLATLLTPWSGHDLRLRLGTEQETLEEKLARVRAELEALERQLDEANSKREEATDA